jgi:hypothetical protein
MEFLVVARTNFSAVRAVDWRIVIIIQQRSTIHHEVVLGFRLIRHYCNNILMSTGGGKPENAAVEDMIVRRLGEEQRCG